MIDGLEILAIVTLVVSAAYVVVRARRRVRLPVPSPILPARELQRQYGLYAENRPTIRLDPDKVPAHLRDLIYMLKAWDEVRPLGLPTSVERA